MKPYNLYINLTDTTEDNYFEVELDGEMAFDTISIDEMPVYRKQWHEVIIKNKPYQYKSDPSNKNKLYDLILDNPPTTTFYIKFVYGETTVYGYFGQVDCKVNETEGIIKVKPSTLDQYTEFIENYDTKVDVFGEQNLIRNGDFEVWSNNIPDGWGKTYLGQLTKKRLLDFNCLKINREIFAEQYVWQIVPAIQNRQIALSYLFAFVGTSSQRHNLKLNVKLNGSGNTYHLTSGGYWQNTQTDITYRTNAYPIPEDKVESLNKFSIVSKPMPISGLITVTFVHDGNVNDALCISNVELFSSAIQYIDIHVNLNNPDVITKPQESVISIQSRHYPWFTTYAPTGGAPLITHYFNEDGSPNMQILSDSVYGMHDGYLRYPDWVNIFQNDPNSSFYKAELCELTIGRGGASSGRANYKGWAKFAREEIVTDDIDLNPIMPEGDGWEAIDYPIKGKTKWVRTPYNGQMGDWELGQHITTQGRYLGFDYKERITSVKQYPHGENSLSITTGVDFRDIVRKIYRSTHNSLLNKEVYSAFFWNDSPYLDDILIASGENYVTRNDNPLNTIACIHSSDLKNLNPMQDDNVLELSWKDFFEDLKLKFPDLIWFVDQDSNLHIEHKKFLNITAEFIDVRNIDSDYHSYEFISNEMYSTYQFNEPNSGYRDFNHSRITYDKIVSNKRGTDVKKELTAQYISTDIQYAIENPANLENGIILIAHNDGVIKYGKGQITGASVPNGDLSISTLLKNYATYEGVWDEGYVNDEHVVFAHTKEVRSGNKLTLKGVNENNHFLTELGIASGETVIDYNNETTEVTPKYRHYDFFIGANETIVKL